MVLAGCGGGSGGKRSDITVDFTLQTVDGKQVTLSSLRGQVVLVNFWTTWCPACKDEMPLLQSVYEQEKAAGFVIVAVDLQESAQTVGAFVKDNGITFPVALDSDSAVASKYGVYYIPHNVIIGRDGLVRRVKVGAFSSAQELLDIIHPLVANK